MAVAYSLKSNKDKLVNNTNFILISILIHLIIIYSTRLDYISKNINNIENEINLNIEKEIEQKFEEELVNPKLKQIVSPSDTHESLITPDTNLLSDKNTKVEKQQIKRGDIPNSKNIKKSKTEANKNKTNINKLLTDILEINKTDLNKDSSTDKFRPNKDNNIKNKKEDSEELINSLSGISGNPDLVSNIFDGEMTLLNAKADRFAVFVRRVALRVFSALKSSNWYEIGDISSGYQTEEVTILATLDKTGKLINTNLIQSSKSSHFDKVIINSVKKGAWDRNPPLTALTNDGFIKFIFKSKALVKGGPQGRSRQWIILSTGLE